MSDTARPPDFLGRGWSFPPRFSRGGAELATVAGDADVRESLAILFATEPGERVMRADYGGGLRPMLFAEMDQELVSALRARVTTAVLLHEPRVRPELVEIADDPAAPGVLLVSLHYTIRGSNSRYNLVFPFYLREAEATAR
jgi:uncharacterized protein